MTPDILISPRFATCRWEYALNIFAGDEVFFSAAGALEGEIGVVAEEFLRLVFPRAEGGKDSCKGTTAVEFEFTGFEDFCFLDVGDFCDERGGEAFEPFFVEVWLGGHEDVSVIGKAEGATGALLGLVVEVLDPFEGIG